jgi:hypothetical protein
VARERDLFGGCEMKNAEIMENIRIECFDENLPHSSFSFGILRMAQIKDEEIKKLIKQNEIMREALNYYANGNNYDACEASMVYYYLYEEQDYVGLRAKEALKKIGEI